MCPPERLLRRRRRLRACAALALGLVLAGCGARQITLPADAGMPLPDFAEIHARVSEACRNVRTLTAELSLSGRAGAERVSRVTVDAGFKRPSMMRLDMRGPLGPTIAALASN